MIEQNKTNMLAVLKPVNGNLVIEYAMYGFITAAMEDLVVGILCYNGKRILVLFSTTAR